MAARSLWDEWTGKVWRSHAGKSHTGHRGRGTRHVHAGERPNEAHTDPGPKAAPSQGQEQEGGRAQAGGQRCCGCRRGEAEESALRLDGQRLRDTRATESTLERG